MTRREGGETGNETSQITDKRKFFDSGRGAGGQMRISVLLGAGASQPAGIPTTGDITSRVRSGEGIMRHTDGVYYLSTNLLPAVQNERVVRLTNALFSEIAAYYEDRRSHPANYENCCYVAAQLRDTESGEFDNPAVEPMIAKLSQEERLRALMGTKQDREVLFSETEHYIRDVVWGMLSAKSSDLKYLNWLTHLAFDEEVTSLELLTLNHDTVLEQALRSNSVAFCDGFGDAVNGIRFWQPNSLQENHRVRLSKLHGSIDWFRFRSNRNIGIALEPDPVNTDPRPELLVGTFNKIVEYTTGVFADLHCHFHQCLRRTHLMVCCGYGFGDKGINTKLSEWIGRESGNRLVVVHRNPDDLFNCSRGAIANHCDEWRRQKKLAVVGKWIEEATWDEVKVALLS